MCWILNSVNIYEHVLQCSCAVMLLVVLYCSIVECVWLMWLRPRPRYNGIEMYRNNIFCSERRHDETKGTFPPSTFTVNLNSVYSLLIVITPWCFAGGHQVSVQGRPPPSVHPGELWERGGLPLGCEAGLGHGAEARGAPQTAGRLMLKPQSVPL